MPEPIRFSATGPAGFLTAPGVALPTATLVEGQPVGLDHAWYDRAEAGVKAGIWRSCGYTEFYDSYAADEFMVVLEGSVTLESDGFSETYRKGDAFFVPKGFTGYWRQSEPMLKYYVIIE